MNPTLSPNTQAILLLTAPLMLGRRGAKAELLRPGEYKRLARHLRSVGQQPADLLSAEAGDVLETLGSIVEAERVRGLLERGFLLSQAVERWSSRAIWVVSRADAAYPRRLKAVMKEDAPAVLYGCGEKRILDCGGLAVVGSRRVDEVLLEYAENTGQLAARAARTLVSGGARGIDEAAMRGALHAGGSVVGVLANGLEQASMQRNNRDHLLEGRLVLVSPQDPCAGFNVGHAMQRNKLIYAFSDASLVVNAEENTGGTWAGATEQLDRLRFVPVYVRSTGAAAKGLKALLRKGALPWPNPTAPDELVDVLNARLSKPRGEALQGTLSLTPYREPALEAHDGPSQREDAAQAGLAEDLFATVRELLLGFLEHPKNEAEVASALGVTRPQARAWLQRLAEDGSVERRPKPVSYIAKHDQRQAVAATGTSRPGREVEANPHRG